MREREVCSPSVVTAIFRTYEFDNFEAFEPKCTSQYDPIYRINASNKRQFKLELQLTRYHWYAKIKRYTDKGGWTIDYKSFTTVSKIERILQKLLAHPIPSKEEIKRNQIPGTQKWKNLKTLPIKTLDCVGYKAVPHIYGKGGKKNDLNNPDMKELKIKADIWVMESGKREYYKKADIDIEERKIFVKNKELKISNVEDFIRMIESSLLS